MIYHKYFIIVLPLSAAVGCATKLFLQFCCNGV